MVNYCERCGCEYYGNKTPSNKNMYCSLRCKRESEKGIKFNYCINCGDRFIDTGLSTDDFCSVKCKSKAPDKLTYKFYCQECGDGFNDNNMLKNAFCSRKCAENSNMNYSDNYSSNDSSVRNHRLHKQMKEYISLSSVSLFRRIRGSPYYSYFCSTITR